MQSKAILVSSDALQGAKHTAAYMMLIKPASLQVLVNGRLHVGEPHERHIGATLTLCLAVWDQTPQKWEDWIAELAGLWE
jgi:hypothetical protein